MDISAASSSPLGTEDVGRLMLKFSIPAIISMLVNAVYNTVDQIFIGWGVGALGLAATNIAFPLVTISTALALLFGVGGASNFNLKVGQGKADEAGIIAGNALFGMVLGGTVLGAMACLFLRPMLIAFGATESILPYAEPYTLITNLGIPFLIFSSGASNLIRADGSPMYSMLCMLSGAVFNLIFDPIFLFVFNMGIKGIALATTLGQILSSALALAYLLNSFKTAPLRKEHLRPHAATLRRISSLGAAACFNQLAMTVVQIVTSNSLRHYGDQSVYGSEIPLAAAGAISKVMFFTMAFILGIAQGSQPIYSFNYGARQYRRVQKTYKLAATAATVISVIAFVCYQLFPRQIMGIFGSDNALFYEFATKYIRIYLLMTFINGIQPVTSNFFTSIGKANLGLWMSLTRQILLLMPLILILPLFWGLDGILWAGPVADAGAAVLAIFFVWREMRRMNTLTAAQPADVPEWML